MVRRIFRRKKTTSKKIKNNITGLGKIADTVNNANDITDDLANGDKISEGADNLASGKDNA